MDVKGKLLDNAETCSEGNSTVCTCIEEVVLEDTPNNMTCVPTERCLNYFKGNTTEADKWCYDNCFADGNYKEAAIHPTCNNISGANQFCACDSEPVWPGECVHLDNNKGPWGDYDC